MGTTPAPAPALTKNVGVLACTNNHVRYLVDVKLSAGGALLYTVADSAAPLADIMDVGALPMTYTGQTTRQIMDAAWRACRYTVRAIIADAGACVWCGEVHDGGPENCK